MSQELSGSASVSIEGSLERLREAGFRPQTIIDIGAHEGSFSLLAERIFRAASPRILMVDALERPGLAETAAALECAYEIAALGYRKREGEKRDFRIVHAYGDTAGSGSSFYPENTKFPQSSQMLPVVHLDDLVAEALDVLPPVLLKLDTQGSEMEILRGARDLVAHVEVILLEASFLQYNLGAPLFAELNQFLSRRGFVLFDIAHLLRRESDQAMFQADLVYCRPGSNLRSEVRPFWNGEPV